MIYEIYLNEHFCKYNPFQKAASWTTPTRELLLQPEEQAAPARLMAWNAQPGFKLGLGCLDINEKVLCGQCQAIVA